MKRTLILLAVLVMVLLSACTINRPVAATSNPIGTKIGTYSQTGILYFPPTMNNKAATLEAAKNGGITKIATVDHNIHWMIFLVKYETIVTGE